MTALYDDYRDGLYIATAETNYSEFRPDLLAPKQIISLVATNQFLAVVTRANEIWVKDIRTGNQWLKLFFNGVMPVVKQIIANESDLYCVAIDGRVLSTSFNSTSMMYELHWAHLSLTTFAKEFGLLPTEQVINLFLDNDSCFIVTEKRLIVKFNKSSDEKKLQILSRVSRQIGPFVFEIALPGNIEKESIQNIIAGQDHLLLLTKEGELYGIGSNNQWQLGLAPNEYMFSSMDDIKYQFVRLAEDKGKILQVAAGDSHTTILTEKGLFACGSNKFGQLGNGTAAPSVLFQSVRNIPVSIDSINSCILTVAGNRNVFYMGNSIYNWGDCGHVVGGRAFFNTPKEVRLSFRTPSPHSNATSSTASLHSYPLGTRPVAMGPWNNELHPL